MQRKTISSHLPRKHSIIAGLYDDRLTYSTFEGELIDSAPVQRLRNVFQQWVSSYIYPDTSHTRFSHSLGVMYLATRMLQNAINNSELTLSADEKERAFLYTRIGGLFHDTGHPPMSHALESHLPNNLTHEDYTMRMLVETTVPNIIQNHGANTVPNTIGPVPLLPSNGRINGPVPLLPSLSDLTLAVILAVFSGSSDSRLAI